MSNNAGPKPPPPPLKKAPPPPPVKKAAPSPAPSENPFEAVVPAAASEPDSLPPIPAAPVASSAPSLPPIPPEPEPEPSGPGLEPLLASAMDDDVPSQLGAAPLYDFDASLGPMTAESTRAAVKHMKRGMSGPTKALLGSVLTAGVALGGWGWYNHNQYEHRMDGLEAIGQIDDPAQMLAALREELGRTKHTDVKERIMRNLGHFRDAEAVPVLIQQLSGNHSVRRGAARALAEIGLPAAEPAKGPLLTALRTANNVDKAQIVWTLAMLRESAASDAIIEMFGAGRLQYLDFFDPKIIVQTVGVERLKSPALTNHAQAAVRVLTAHALAEAASPEVVEPLAGMITSELARQGDARNEEVIRSAAAGLGRTGATAAARPLFAVLTNERSLRQGVLDALGNAAAAPQLAVLLPEATEPSIRKDLARLLTRAHDPRGADALAGLLTDADLETRAIAAIGLAQVGDRRAMPVLIELARLTDNDALRRQGFTSLRLVSSPASTRDLLQLLRDVPASRTDVLRALGRSGDPSVARVLISELENDDAQAAALALGDLNDNGSFSSVLRMAARPGDIDMGATTSADRNPSNETMLGERRAAILALGKFGRDAAFDTLVRIVEDQRDDFELRRLAASSIGQVATDDQMRTVIQKIQAQVLPEVTREYYGQALWQQARPALNTSLFEIVASDSTPGPIRRGAALAIGFAADPANDARLVQLLENESSRRYAAFAIALGAGEAAVEALRSKLGVDNDLKEVFRAEVTDTSNNRFRVLTEQMFASGAIWRRVRTAWQLKQGEGDTVHGYVWDNLVKVFEQGYEGANGALPQFIREQLWTAIQSEDEAVRTVAARMLIGLRERGILLRARDAGGVAEQTARQILREQAARASSGS